MGGTEAPTGRAGSPRHRAFALQQNANHLRGKGSGKLSHPAGRNAAEMAPKKGENSTEEKPYRNICLCLVRIELRLTWRKHGFGFLSLVYLLLPEVVFLFCCYSVVT